MRAALVLLVLGTGCGSPEQDTAPVRWHDYGTFVNDVQPVLAEHCGNASCHGRPERPLAVYSVRRYRMDPARTHLDEALTDEELRHNYTLCCVLSSEGEGPSHTLLLKKPRGSTAAVYHGGGDVFEATTDRDYRVLLAWVETGWP